jgi:hypothetical protein
MAGGEVRVQGEDVPAATAKAAQRAFYPPTVYEVKRFARKYDLQVDVREFINFHTEREWLDRKGDPITDWRAEAILWHDEAVLKRAAN